MRLAKCLMGGPWNLKVLFLNASGNGTFYFELGNWKGYYNEDGRWNDGQRV